MKKMVIMLGKLKGKKADQDIRKIVDKMVQTTELKLLDGVDRIDYGRDKK